MRDSHSILNAAGVIGFCTLLSRLTGLARDMLLFHAFGARWVNDAFLLAFQIPNLFRRLFGEGALSAAFVPVFAQTLERDGQPAAWQLLSRTLTLLLCVLLVLLIALELGILGLHLLSPPDPANAAARALQLGLAALMLPFMVSICIVALLSGMLNCVGSFGLPALTPIVLNLMMIAAIVWLGPQLAGPDPAAQIYIVAASVLAAGAVQIVLLIPAIRGRGIRIRWRFEPRDPQVRALLTRMAPVVLGQGVLLFGVYLDAQICNLLARIEGGPSHGSLLGLTFAYPLREGALASITVAQRLYQFPLGVLAISLATAALPAFSRAASRGAWDEWGRQVGATLRLAAFEGLLTGAMMIVLATPIVRFLFEYGRFEAADTGRAAVVLAWYGAAMWAYCVQHIVLRGFYSLGDVRTPVRLSCVLLPLNVLLSLILVWFPAVRESAFAISSLLTSTLNVVWGLHILHRRCPSPLWSAELAAALGRMLAAAALSAAAVAIARQQWVHWFGPPGTAVVQRAAEALGGLTLGSIVYLGLTHMAGLPEPAALLRKVLRRTARRTGPVR